MAMLFVLGVLTLCVTATALIARARTTDRLNTLISVRLAGCEQLREAADGPIRDWLLTESPSAVLSPEAERPVVPVLSDWWVDNSEAWSLQITAWDQCGMVPMSAVADGRPLFDEVPLGVVQVIQHASLDENVRFGLDQFWDGKVSPFPETEVESLLTFGVSAAELSESEDPSEASSVLRLGDVVATHSPGRGHEARANAPIWINVNTAPMALVRRAFDLVGIDGLETVRQSRAEGKLASINFRASARERGGEAPIRFVTSSPVWAFRIDTEVMGVRRSWWEVWTSEHGNWEAVQRLAIPG